MSPKEFSETQVLHPVFWLVLLVVGVVLPLVVLLQGMASWSLLVPFVLCVVIVVLFSPMRTTLQDGRLRVSYGLFSLFSWTFLIQDLQRVEAVTYRPLGTYLGWGIRRGFDGSRALTMRGNRGAMLHLTDGKRYLIGSQRAEELAGKLGG